jgi:arylsulfatase A-like enzyme
MGNDEKVRVIPTPSNPGGLDPAKHVSLATALKKGGYRTGMSGKWVSTQQI